ncbi:hypothetical protein NHX12_027441 [Muraenolepis orangiensis]|uniref:Uncharacterized protein n=1 Tax=Muraenolepis orangiensis TaxID=630683 RepID=A0A9Q0INU8_9TELE|nr:hypothetical protein NHX12_027441 [Muraenolepis orangiensis]
MTKDPGQPFPVRDGRLSVEEDSPTDQTGTLAVALSHRDGISNSEIHFLQDELEALREVKQQRNGSVEPPD